jgi:hypothetical protein
MTIHRHSIFFKEVIIMTKRSKLFITFIAMIVMLTGCGIKERLENMTDAPSTIRGTEATITFIGTDEPTVNETDEASESDVW